MRVELDERPHAWRLFAAEADARVHFLQFSTKQSDLMAPWARTGSIGRARPSSYRYPGGRRPLPPIDDRWSLPPTNRSPRSRLDRSHCRCGRSTRATFDSRPARRHVRSIDASSSTWSAPAIPSRGRIWRASPACSAVRFRSSSKSSSVKTG